MNGRYLRAVQISPLPIERFRDVLDDDRYRDLLALRDTANALLRNRAVWCVNSTANGGGVAEMLRSLLAFTRGSGVDTRWMVLRGDPAFFALTKRLHNRLHESRGDGGPLGPAERVAYEAVCDRGARELAKLVRPGDVIILHDPQTAGMVERLKEAGAGVVWRGHIGVDAPGPLAHEAWEFLMPYVGRADATVFSRRRFVWEGLDPERVMIIPPSIDVFSAKNQPLGEAVARSILRVIGVLEPDDGDGSDAVFLREDGTPGRVDRPGSLIQDAPLAEADRYVAQVSRWDRLKDPVGVLQGWAEHVAAHDPAHLLLVGPSVEGVADDPEGGSVLAEVTAARAALEPEARARVHLVSLPMGDAEENAAMVNAIQSCATVIVQKSLAEGFGLTVAEAMWKARPIVASSVGGIQDQVVDQETGLLVEATDLEAFGRALVRLLTDDGFATRLGAAAYERVRQDFLEPRHLAQWVAVIKTLPPGPAVPPAPSEALAT
jgi:trehalose synthase